MTHKTPASCAHPAALVEFDEAVAYLSEYMAWGEGATNILNWVEPADPPMGYDPTVRPPPFRISMRGCIIHDSVPAARDCDREGTNCTSALSGYPLAGLSGNWSYATGGILGKVWDLVDFTIGNGDVDDTHPIQTGVVVPFEYDSSAGEMGLALGHNPATPALNGSAVIRWDVDSTTHQGGSKGVLASEIGHTLGLAHDDAIYPDTSISGFMAGGPAPVLDWTAQSNIDLLTQGQVWQQMAPTKFVPRPSGFKHQGCDGDDEVCNNGHPGLVCSSNDFCDEAP